MIQDKVLYPFANNKQIRQLYFGSFDSKIEHIPCIFVVIIRDKTWYKSKYVY